MSHKQTNLLIQWNVQRHPDNVIHTELVINTNCFKIKTNISNQLNALVRRLKQFIILKAVKSNRYWVYQKKLDQNKMTTNFYFITNILFTNSFLILMFFKERLTNELQF